MGGDQVGVPGHDEGDDGGRLLVGPALLLRPGHPVVHQELAEGEVAQGGRPGGVAQLVGGGGHLPPGAQVGGHPDHLAECAGGEGEGGVEAVEGLGGRHLAVARPHAAAPPPLPQLLRRPHHRHLAGTLRHVGVELAGGGGQQVQLVAGLQGEENPGGETRSWSSSNQWVRGGRSSSRKVRGGGRRRKKRRVKGGGGEEDLPRRMRRTRNSGTVKVLVKIRRRRRRRRRQRRIRF